MKRFCAMLGLAVLAVCSSFSTKLWAWSDEAIFNFVNSIQPVAAKIASHQKPVLQEPYGRLWRDKKNYVAYGYNRNWKNATLGYFETTDTSLRFAGNIHIGSSQQQVFNFFQEIGPNPYVLLLDSMAVTFRFNNGKVSKICFSMFEDSGLDSTNKIWSTIKSRSDTAQR